jgi:hypothetical protein
MIKSKDPSQHITPHQEVRYKASAVARRHHDTHPATVEINQKKKRRDLSYTWFWTYNFLFIQFKRSVIVSSFYINQTHLYPQNQINLIDICPFYLWMNILNFNLADNLKTLALYTFCLKNIKSLRFYKCCS